MIDFGDKTYRNILARQLARVPDTIDKREGSIIQTALGPESWFLEGLYLDLDQVQKNAYAGTAGGVELELICEERGIYRKSATPAVKKGIFNVSVPIGSRFSTRAGDNVTYAARKALGGTEGAYVYELECETAGRAGNSYSGPLLSIDYIKGLASAELSELIEAGTEDEEERAILQRLRPKHLLGILPLTGMKFWEWMASVRSRCIRHGRAAVLYCAAYLTGILIQLTAACWLVCRKLSALRKMAGQTHPEMDMGSRQSVLLLRSGPRRNWCLT